MMIALILVVLLLTGLPIYVCLGLTSLIFFVAEGIPLDQLTRTFYTGVDQYALISVTGFLLVGSLFEKAGVTEALVNMVRRLMASFRSGLAVITIISCAIFAAVSGSGPATVATIGGIMVPAMIKAGYTRKFSAGVAASGGALGILIPPSNPFLMYGIIANQSVAALFTAGFIPGFIMAIALSFTSVILLRFFPRFTTAGRQEERAYQPLSLKEAISTIWDAKWAILAIIILLGGIYAGFFTPIEAAEVTVFYSIFIGFFVTRSMKLKDLYEAFANALKLSGTLIILTATGFVFARLLTILGIPQAMGQSIGKISDNPNVILLIIMAFMIFVGTWAETFSQIIVLTPIFLPIITQLGVNPIHFGVLFVVCAEIGFLTPPFGANLFVAMKLSNITLEESFVASIPFILCYIAILVVLVFFPEISLFLPRLIFGRV
ncbi:MAG TPA: TRAP transporter large permease [Spirochaetales bacterium]|nr:TRAP transporter large permease [Spirochaetales bacterium]HOV39680.1 TRAP transporter large permease [Spirochaetales bacterium]